MIWSHVLNEKVSSLQIIHYKMVTEKEDQCNKKV